MQRKQGQWKELFHVKEPFSAASSGKQQTAGCILRFQRRLAPAGVFNGAPGGLVLVFVVDGGKHGTLGPCFGGLVDEADSVSVQMPPVREDDQMVEFDGIQGSSVFIRPLNEPVAEFLRGNVIGHADSCGRYYRKRRCFSQH